MKYVKPLILIFLVMFTSLTVSVANAYVINSAQDIKPGIIKDSHFTTSSSPTDKLSWLKISGATIPITKLNQYDPTTIAFGGVPMADGSGNIVWSPLGFGQFLPLTGGTMTGSILPSSISVNLGASAAAWGNAWINNVNATSVISNGVRIPAILSAGYLATDASGNIIAGPGGSAVGTVTSVALSVPSFLSISGSPITTSGTIAITGNSASAANKFIATPNGTTGAPALRNIVQADLPTLTGNIIAGGTFGAVNGSALTGIAGANVVGNIFGNAANITGIATIVNGGTGQSTPTAAFNALSPMNTLGDMLYGGTAGAASRLPGNALATKKFLTQTGTGTVSAVPAWGTIIAGDLPVINVAGGGTGATSFTAGTLIGSDAASSTAALRPITIGSGLSLTGSVLTAPASSPSGTIPIGGIIMWSGSSATIPSGWALCDGTTVSGVITPDLRQKFIQGATADGGALPHAATGGAASYTYSGTVTVSGTTGNNSDSGTLIITSNNNNVGSVYSTGINSNSGITFNTTASGLSGFSSMNLLAPNGGTPPLSSIVTPYVMTTLSTQLWPVPEPSHTHSIVWPSHAHSFNIGSHTHSISASGGVPTATIGTIPPYYALCFIERVF